MGKDEHNTCKKDDCKKELLAFDRENEKILSNISSDISLKLGENITQGEKVQGVRAQGKKVQKVKVQEVKVQEVKAQEVESVTDNLRESIQAEGKIVYIVNKKIISMNPQSFHQGEMNADAILFEMDRFYHGVDLLGMVIEVVFKIGKLSYNSPVSNVKGTNTKIRFDWIIDDKLTKFASVVPYLIQITGKTKTEDGFIWKSNPSYITIMDPFMTDQQTMNTGELWFNDIFIDMENKISKNETESISYQMLTKDLKNRFTHVIDTGVLNALNKDLSSCAKNVNDLTNQKVDKLKLFGNVKDYGAKGDWNNDDTNAIQNCIRDCKCVYIPAGNYLTKGLVVPSGRMIFGDHYNSWLVVHPETKDYAIFMLEKNSIGYNTFCNIHIHGNKTKVKSNVVVHGIANCVSDESSNDAVINMWLCVFGCQIRACSGDGIHLQQRGMVYHFTDSEIWDCNYGIYARHTSDSVITSCEINSCEKCGVYWNGSNLRIIGTKLFLNGRSGDYAGMQFCSSGMVMSACEFQQNCYDGLLLENCSLVMINTTLFDSNNKKGIVGEYGQLKLMGACVYNNISIAIMLSRFLNEPDQSYQMEALNGIVISCNQTDSLQTCMNQFDIRLGQLQSTIATDWYMPNIIPDVDFKPYNIPSLDSSSSYQVNGREWFLVRRKRLNFGSTIMLRSNNVGKFLNRNGVILTNSVDTGILIDVPKMIQGQENGGAVQKNAYISLKIPLTSMPDLKTGDTVSVHLLAKSKKGVRIYIDYLREFYNNGFQHTTSRILKRYATQNYYTDLVVNKTIECSAQELKTYSSEYYIELTISFYANDMERMKEEFQLGIKDLEIGYGCLKID